MKAILTIGYRSYLLPDSAMAAKALEILSKAIPVNDRLYTKTIELCDDRELELAMKIVPSGTRFTTEKGEPVDDAPVWVKKTPRGLKAPPILTLEDRP